jgi:hypothetical protein
MNRRIGWRGVAGLLVAGSLALATGCQTWLGGMTLPSSHYLQDNPDYIPKGPSFPLEREAAAMQAAARNVTPPGPVPGTPVP